MVGGPEESPTRALSGSHSAKRLKDLVTPPLSSTIPSYNRLVTTGLSRPLLDFSEAKTVLPKRADHAEATSHHLEPDRPKTLRSPFEYTRDLVTNHIDPIGKNSMQRFDLNRSLRSWNSSEYIYFAPTNPSDKTSQASDIHRRVPRQRLSYGDPPSKPGSRLHKSTGSWELRHEAERHAEGHNLDLRSNTTLNASAARPYHFRPAQSKHRLCFDSSERKDEIQEAVSIIKL